MTCDLTAQIRSRISASPGRVISKPRLYIVETKSSQTRVHDCHEGLSTTALTTIQICFQLLLSKTFAGVKDGGFCARSRKYI